MVVMSLLIVPMTSRAENCPRSIAKCRTDTKGAVHQALLVNVLNERTGTTGKADVPGYSRSVALWISIG
jgi:hypothetical protein